jgi:hypothetical protein
MFGTAPDAVDGWVADRPIKGMKILSVRSVYFSDGSRRYYLHAAAPPPPPRKRKPSAAPIKAKKLNRKQRRMKARAAQRISRFSEHDHKKRENDMKETPQQITEQISELSRYLVSAQKVVDNYKTQIAQLEEKRAELLDAGFKPVFGREAIQ